MKFVDNGVPEDFARLCFKDMKIPLCELTEEEYREVVYGIEKDPTQGKLKPGHMVLPVQGLQNSLFSKSIDYLELSVRPTNRLNGAGIDTIGQLCQLTENDVKQLRGMGDKSVAEIKTALIKLGLDFKEAAG